MEDKPNVLLLTPPLLQPNTAYSATPLLYAYLKRAGFPVRQADLSLELLLELLTPRGLAEARDCLLADGVGAASDFVMHFPRYAAMVEPVVAFLQGRDPEAAWRLARRGTLPEGPRLRHAWDCADEIEAAFGGSAPERARYLASLFLDDIADAAKFADPFFGFSRYAEQLAVHLPRFAPLRRELLERDSFVTRRMDAAAERVIAEYRPDLVAITVPFPGTLFGALRIGRRIRRLSPATHVAIGGGYCDSELRGLSAPAVFDFVDSIVLDGGPLALRRLAEFVGGGPDSLLIKTMQLRDGAVILHDSGEAPLPHGELPAPSWDGLAPGRHFGLVETLNPVTRLWTEGRWNRLLLAHGCPWSRCAFCDSELDCIARYDPTDTATACDWIAAVIAETGRSGFHFVDESLDACFLDRLCDAMLERGLQCTWWGNIRFEKAFTPALVGKLAAAGCIAVAGGLETACDRTLKLMRKGISMEQAERVMRDFATAGILVHAYLMHAFPSQTDAEVLAADRAVERMLAAGILHSYHWHRFALSAHSDIARDPGRYSIELLPEPESDFARNEIPWRAIPN
jgi:radical SAM superfamily enzyme YgiQ (UPF0313 family)